MSKRIDNDVELYWGTPIYSTNLKDSDLSRLVLKDYISKNDKIFHSLDSSTIKHNSTSLSNLDNWSIKESKPLKATLLKHFSKLMIDLECEYNDQTPITLICSFAGAGINNKKIQIQKKKSAWTALCFLDVVKKEDIEYKISFLDPRYGAGMVFDGFEAFGTSRELNLSNRQLVFFPSWLIPSDKSDLNNNNLFYVQFEFSFPELT